MTDEVDMFSTLLKTYGPIGVFLVSFLGNALPYSTIPYLILVILYSSTLDSTWDQIIITVLGGLGAALGKIIVYYFGYGLRYVLTSEQRRNLETFASLFKRSTFLAVFLFAALPLPDDILYVPLGASRYSLTRYTIALVSGKIIITGAAVFFGSSFTWITNSVTDLPPYVSITILLYVTLWLTYLVSKIDWLHIARTYKRRGIIAGTLELLRISGKESLNFLLLPYRVLKGRLVGG